MMKGKNLQPRNFYTSRLSLRFERQIKSFTEKQKLKELQKLKAPQTQFYKKCYRDFSKQGKKGPNQKYENYERNNLIGKGKYIIKVDRSHLKLIGRLKDKSSKIIYIHNKQLRDTQKD